MWYLIGYLVTGLALMAGLSLYYSGTRAHSMSPGALLLLIFIWPAVLLALIVVWFADKEWCGK